MAAAWFSLVLSVVAIIISALHLPIILSALANLTPIHLFSATCAGIMAIAILLRYAKRQPWISKALALLVLLLTSLVLFDTGFQMIGFGRSTTWLSQLQTVPPNSAFCLACVSLAFLLISGNARYQILAQFIAVVAAIVPALALIGYSYEVQSLYNIGHFRAMSLPGAIDYFLVAVSLLLDRADFGIFRIVMSDHPVGSMARRLNLAVFAALPLLGLISILSATSTESYELPFAVAFLVVSSMVLMSSVVAFVSHRLEDAYAVQLSIQASLRESQHQLRQLSAYSQSLQEEERVRIAREVHDELGQSLTALKMDVALLRNVTPSNPEDLDHRTASMMELVNHTIRSVQRISSELRPSVLDNLGLAAAIEWQAKEFCTRAELACHIHVTDEEIPIENPRSTALFRIFQETLTNIGRHAAARNVWISLRRFANDLTLEVRDDGIGMSSVSLSDPHSFGLIGMKERAALLGGTIEFSSEEAAGTLVTVTIPVQVTENDSGSESISWSSADITE